MIFDKHINKYYLRYSAFLIIGLASLFAVDMLQLIIPNLYQMLINGINDGYVNVDGVRTTFDTGFLVSKICMPMITVILSMVFCRFLWRMMFLGSAVKMEAHLRNRMFDTAKDLSNEYYQVHKVGDLMSLFTNDLDTVQDCFGWGIMMVFDALTLSVMAIIKMVRMNPVLTVLSMIPAVLLLASSTVVGNYMSKKWDIRQAAFSKLSDFSQESFSGIAVIKAFVKEGKELWAFKKINVENEKANIEFTRASVLFRILVIFFVESVIGVILGYGGYLVYVGTFNAGQLVEFIGYFTAIVWPILAVSDLIDMTSRGRASVKRIGKLLDAKPNVFDKEGAEDIADIKGEIEFRNLSFKYPGSDRYALENVSFKVNPGERIGICGRTGCGKTTVVDLILRIYNVDQGTLFIDGRDVNDITIRSLRDGCAYVPQDGFLFSDTIENNISFGVNEYDMEKVRAAAVNADIDGNISEFSEGYGTVLGERGVTVSGGQKQRISIARALMKDAPILILDDSVSAVDTKTEKHILERLEKTREGRTTLIIAHRISTIEKLDRILFLKEGKVLAYGTHEELIESCPEYENMVLLQKLEEGEEVESDV